MRSAFTGAVLKTKRNVCIPHGANCLVIPNGARIIDQRWMSLAGFPEEANSSSSGERRWEAGCLLSGCSERAAGDQRLLPGADIPQDKGQVKGLLGFSSSLLLRFHDSHAPLPRCLLTSLHLPRLPRQTSPPLPRLRERLCVLLS